jgi:integrase
MATQFDMVLDMVYGVDSKGGHVMNRTLHRLTDKLIQSIANTAPGAPPKLYPDGGGLYLRAYGAGRSWLFRWARDGRSHDKGLGHYPDRTLPSARREAQRLRTLLIEQGPEAVLATMRRSPAATVTASVTFPRPVKVLTFDQCAAEYIKGQESKWTRDHWRQWTNSIRQYISPVIGKMPVDEIDTPDVLRVLKPVWELRNPTARRLRDRIEIILSWAKARGHRNGGENPARWGGHLEHLLPRPGKLHQVEHFEALPVRDAPAFMARLRKIDDVAARALEWTMLTGVRREAARDARWSEVNTEAGTWTVPIARGKSKAHVVPLSPAALDLLAKLPRISDHIFVRPTGAPIGKNATLRVMTDLAPGKTVHGLRSTFRDWCSENGHGRELAELSLGHKIGDATEQAYARSKLIEQRRAIMTAWAEYCMP